MIGADPHAHAPDRHGEAAPLRRIDARQRRLRPQHQDSAEHILQQPEARIWAIEQPALHSIDAIVKPMMLGNMKWLAAKSDGQTTHRCGHDCPVEMPYVKTQMISL